MLIFISIQLHVVHDNYVYENGIFVLLNSFINEFNAFKDDILSCARARRRRQLRHDDEIAAVELRDEADRRVAEFVEAEADDDGVDAPASAPRRRTDARREPAIAARQRVEAAVEARGRSRGSARSTSGRAVRPACGLSSSAHSAGDSVSETISEMTVAPAMVSANCR